MPAFLVGLVLAVPSAGAQRLASPPADASRPSCTGIENRPQWTPIVRCVSPLTAGLGDRITITVDNLQKVLTAAGGCDSISLFVAGLSLSGVSPNRCDPSDGQVGFILSRTEADGSAWNQILGRPTSFAKPVSISIGSSPTRSLPTLHDAVALQFEQLPKLQFWLFVGLALFTLGLVVILAVTTSLLREPRVDPEMSAGERQYSLGRTQQVFWFTVAVLGYMFVWLVTSDLNSLSDSTLVLVTISAATTFGGEAIGRGGTQDDRRAFEKLRQTESRLKEDGLAGAAGDSVKQAAAQAQLADVQKEIEAKRKPFESDGFVKDLLRDQNGVSPQRVQIVVWTIVLGSIFVIEVYAHLTMPNFSAALLTLMGISSGTYLAGKTGEAGATPRAASASSESTPA